MIHAMRLAALLLLSLPIAAAAQYTGTASVTQGLATTTVTDLYSCTGGRVTNLGTIGATDATTWTVPAAVMFKDASVPFASDLHNVCAGAAYANAAAALAALDGSDIVTVDVDGEVITGFIFADNYFEMYVNGVAVGKDKVPFTPFNSSIVRFRVRRPFTIAMLLVDWEEHLGVGCEANGGKAYHAGDGGMVAVFKDAANTTVAITNSAWKAQTFYTAPIKDLTCPREEGMRRLSNACNTQDAADGSQYYALHWSRPATWREPTFDDANWPAATTYTNAEIGVDNKPAYTNFTNVFDDPANDAQFIWSTNVILDNEVIVRYTVPTTTSVDDESMAPSPAMGDVTVYSLLGVAVYQGRAIDLASIPGLASGIYIVDEMRGGTHFITKRLIP